MIVLKFGGSSIGNPTRMKNLASILQSNPKEMKLVVLSAISGVTNELEKLFLHLKNKEQHLFEKQLKKIKTDHLNFAKELLSEKECYDSAEKAIRQSIQDLNEIADSDFQDHFEGCILAQGEFLSTKLFNLYLNEIQIESQLLYAPELIELNEEDLPNIKKIKENLISILHQNPSINLFITQGFICSTAKKQLGNLKRGGSDYSASLFGAALEAKEIHIWTDIDGVHNNDPRYVPNTKSVEQLSYEEAAELAYFGAKILHPQSIHPARKHNIPVRLLNTLSPESIGTCISGRAKNKGTIAIAAKDNITAIRIQSSRMLLAYGFLKNIFEVFEKYKTPIDMITTSEVAVSMTIDNTKNLNRILNELEPYGQVEIDSQQSIVCIVGDFSGETHGKAAVITDALKHLPIRMISYGGSEHNISVLLPQPFKIEALRSLQARLF